VKSSQVDIEKRGFLKQGKEREYLNLSLSEMLALLYSEIPKERTLGARLLGKESHFVADKLIHALSIETKLYPKIEICEALVQHENDSIGLLVNELGRIGTNQHQCLPEKDFNKDNYPLPRDIAARTLGYIGRAALPKLLELLEINNEEQVIEAIDAIGYICFYDSSNDVYKNLLACFERNLHNDLVRWKIYRAMSCFPQSVTFLVKQKSLAQNNRLLMEIDRSLRLIEKKKMKFGL